MECRIFSRMLWKTKDLTNGCLSPLSISTQASLKLFKKKKEEILLRLKFRLNKGGPEVLTNVLLYFKARLAASAFVIVIANETDIPF